MDAMDNTRLTSMEQLTKSIHRLLFRFLRFVLDFSWRFLLLDYYGTFLIFPFALKNVSYKQIDLCLLRNFTKHVRKTQPPQHLR
jgi:hypothetical protein